MIEWHPTQGKYATGDDAYLGKIKVGWAGYSSTGSKGDPKKYAASVALPGIKISDRYETPEPARARVEQAVIMWIKAAGLIPPNPNTTEQKGRVR